MKQNDEAVANAGVLAKISRPRLVAAYTRTRLIRLLDRYADAPITWISGPPGAGKTTLASSYVDTTDQPGLWYRLDGGDDDAASFFYYLSLAAERISASAFTDRITPEPGTNIEVFSRRFFERLYGVFDGPFTMVFDNHHVIAEESSLHEIFRYAFERLPEHGRAIVISRGDPPKSLARLQSYGAVRVIGPADMRLNASEARGIASSWRRWDGHRRLIGDLHKKTEGWTAGLVLLLASIDPATDAVDEIPAGGREHLFRFFRAEILDRSDPDSRDVLLRCALPPTVSADIARELTGNRDAERIIAKIHEQNFFTERLSEHEPVYRFHPLFREFLLETAGDFLGEAEVRKLRRRAAELLDRSGFGEEAANLLLHAREWGRLLSLCERLAPAMLAQGRGDTLKHWLLQIPEEIRSRDVRALSWLGHVELPRDPVIARDLFYTAFALAEKQGDEAAALTAWCGAVDAIVYNWDDFTALDPWIERIERFEAGGRGYPSTICEAQVASSMFGALIFRRPDHPRLHQWAERGLALARRCGDAPLLIRLVEVQSHFYAWTGDLARSGILLEESNRLLTSISLPVMVFLGNRMQEAVYRWHRAEFPEALAAVEEGLGEARQQGVHLLDARLAAQGVYASIGAGDLDAARRYLDVMRDAPMAGRKLDISHYHFLNGWHALVCGDSDAALEETRRGNLMAQELGAPFPVALSGLNVARVQHALGEYALAEKLLDQSRRLAAAMGSRMLACQTGLIAADFALDHDDPDGAAEHLSAAFAIGRQEGYWMTPLWDPGLMARLCAFALESGIESAFVTRLVRRRKLAPPAARFTGPDWPWPVRIETLGRFFVECDGEPVSFDRKARSRPLELLRALVAMGGRDVNESLLADLLWPAAEGDAAAQSLATTLHRTRRMLGRDDSLQRQEGRISINRQVCWCDTLEFNDRMERAEALPEGTPRRSLIEDALRLYGGPFLAGHGDTPWALAARERLEDRFTRGVGELAGDAAARGSTDALKWYSFGIERAPCCEPLYRESIRLHLAAGDAAVAISTYRRLKHTLEVALGISPSLATRDLIRPLLADGV